MCIRDSMSTGLDALVVSLRVQAVTQSAVTFVLQAGKIGFPALAPVNTTLGDSAVAANPV